MSPLEQLCLDKGMKMTEQNEERIATMTGEIARRFWRKYDRWVASQPKPKPRPAPRKGRRVKRKTRKSL